MQAVVYRQYGLPDVLHVEEIARPTPRDDEVLVKVQAVSLNRSDWEGLLGILAVQPNRKDLAAVAELCAAGKVAPIIDRRYPLHEVPAALQYLGEGRAKGKVVIIL